MVKLQQQQTMEAVLQWLTAAVRTIAAHNTEVCTDYLKTPDADNWQSLPLGERRGIFNGAMALVGSPHRMPSGLWDEDYERKGLAAAAGAELVPFVAVHQRMSPFRVHADDPRHLSLTAWYNKTVEGGTLPATSPDYVTAVKVLTEGDDSPLCQRWAKAGYTVWVRADMDAQPRKRRSKRGAAPIALEMKK